jgi:hypothetical protein
MKIVRVKETNYYERGHHSTIQIISYKEYLERSQWKAYGQEFKLVPYKWWNIQYLWEIPAYLLLRNSRWKAFKPTRIAARIAIVLAESTLIYFFTKFFLIKICP